MTLRLAEVAMALLAVGLFVGCSRGRVGEAPQGAGLPEMSAPVTTAGNVPAPAASTTAPSGSTATAPAETGPIGSTGGGASGGAAASSGSSGGSPGPEEPLTADTVPREGDPALLAACAAVATLDAAQPPVVEQAATLLAEVRTLAADTIDPRAADARLHDLVPRARRIGADLVRDGRALSGLVPDLGAGPHPDRAVDLDADLAGAAAAAAGAEVLLGERLAAVDRIDDLVVAAQAPAADPVAASAQRATVRNWATVSCASPDGG